MPRAYDRQLLNDIQRKQKMAVVDEVPILFKSIPDCDLKGAMDPRLYKDMKKVAFVTRFLPKRLLQGELNLKSLDRLRAMFGSVDSTPLVDDEVEQLTEIVIAEDGAELPIHCFKTAKTLENAPMLYYIHGGGFFGGSTEVVADALKLLVANTNILAFSIDYRLAPEHPYPTGHQDCYSGLKWLQRNGARFGGNPQAIFVGGDSAGGNLTLYCTTRSLADGIGVKGQLLLYPTVNMGGVDDDHVRFTKDKFDIYEKQKRAINLTLDMLSGATSGLGNFLGVKDLLIPELTPYLHVPPEFPPTFVTVGEHDFLKVETLAYARKLILAGVETTTIVYKGLGHAYLDKIGYFPQSEDCVREMGNFILAHN